MQAAQTITASDAVEAREPIRVWIESAEGSIVRGLVDVLSEDGAVILWNASDEIGAGDEVTVRLSFARNAPTFTTRARVSSIRAQEDIAECELEWLPGPERERLASFVATLG